MTLDELLERVELGKVDAAVQLVREGQPALKEYDIEDARRMVVAAAEKWLLKDWGAWADVKTELSLSYSIGAWGQINGIIDLTGTLQTSKQPFILDWKTSRNTLDEEWSRRQKDSWQWRLYSLMTGATTVIYRGLSRPKLDRGKWKCDTREIVLEVPENNGEIVGAYLDGVIGMRQTLVEMGLDVWPMYKPGACGAFGQVCPFLPDCRQGTMPRSKVMDRDMSYTQLERFSLCPEKHRRMLLDGVGKDESEEALFGQAVHRGLSDLYSQVWKG